MATMKIMANDQRLIRLFQNFTDAVNRGDIKRISYNEYREVRTWLQYSDCPECGDAEEYLLYSDGSLECPDCGLVFDPDDFSSYLTTGLQNIFRQLVTYQMSTTKKDPKTGVIKTTIENKIEKVEGGNDMFNMNGILKNLQFGVVKGEAFKLSAKGIAFKSKDGYVTYNSEAGELTDVTGMTFDIDNAVFSMPVSHSKVAVDDIIIHAGTPVVVKEIKAKTLVVVYPFAQEVKEIMPAKNMFNFNFYTKITAMFDMNGADEENPFGNVLPFMMMNGSNGGDMNPMMLMMMMGDKKESGIDKDMMMAMAMMGTGANQGGNNNMMMALAMSKMFK